MKKLFCFVRTRLRAACAVLTARQCIVVAYDSQKLHYVLDGLYLCGPGQEAPARLEAAVAITREWDNIDSDEGQRAALALGRQLYAAAARRQQLPAQVVGRGPKK